MTEAAPKFKVPKSLALTADRLWEVREARYAADKAAAALKAEESFLKEYLINNLPKSDAQGIAGKRCRVTVKMKHSWVAENWDSVWAYCAKNLKQGGFAVLQKRLSDTACEDYFTKTKKPLPGTKQFDYPDLSINKV